MNVLAGFSESKPSFVSQSACRPVGRSGCHIAKRPARICFFRVITDDQLYVRWRQCFKKMPPWSHVWGSICYPTPHTIGVTGLITWGERRQNWLWVFGCLYSASRKKRGFHCFLASHQQNSRL